MTDPGIEERIPQRMRLVLDTSILIAYLKADEAVSPLARTVIHGYLGSERNEGVLSTLSAGEVLVVPNRDGAAREVALDIMDMPGLQLRSVDFLVAAEAARIRAEASLPLPDAVVIATGFLSNAQILVTNDRRLATAAPQVVPEMAVVLLSDLV